jgi:hypothetical protein
MVKMAGSNQGASSAYTEAGPPEMMIALQRWRVVGGSGVMYIYSYSNQSRGLDHVEHREISFSFAYNSTD